MSEDRHARIGRLLLAATRLPERERAAWIRAECDDDALCAEVLDLLRHHETPAVDLDRSALDTIAAPRRIAGFTIIDVLGRGGMGVVYRAEQRHPTRRVALKVLRPGIISERMLRRFEFEAQALGRLHHPAIAQIYEAGAAPWPGDDEPRPYFAMELIDGRPIDVYVEAERLHVRDRLALLARVCDAIDHAHTRGVIHRDLKPANILVDEHGQPRVLDFGVARAVDADVRTTTMHTDTGQLVGTVSYMSPEQCGADPDAVDTRSDVYALGVLGYQLLTGHLPYELDGRPLHESVGIIREQDPTALRTHDRSLRGDVETIIRTALRKDPARRYQSAHAMATDIRRYLDDTPIVARPPSAVYQLQMFARRHRVLVTGSVTIVAVLVIALAASLVLLTRTLAAEAEARGAVADAESASDFLGDLISISNPRLSRGDISMTVRDLLDVAADEVGPRFVGRPLVEATIRRRIGAAYQSLRINDAAVTHLSRAVALYAELGRDGDADALDAATRLTNVLVASGRHAEVMDAARRNVSRALEAFPPDADVVVQARNALAVVLHRLSRFDEAAATLESAIADAGGRDEALTRATIAPVRTLSTVRLDQGRYDDALALAIDVERATIALEGAGHAASFEASAHVIAILVEMSRFEEAADRSLPLIAGLERGFGPDHPDTVEARLVLARAIRGLGHFEEAEALYRSAADGPAAATHPDLRLDALNGLAITLNDAGRSAEALPVLQKVVVARTERSGALDPPTLAARANLANALMALGRLDEAEPMLVTVRRDYAATVGADHPIALTVTSNLASLYYGRNDLAEAEPLFRHVLAREREQLGPDDASYLVTLQNLARTLTKLGRAAEAEPLYVELLDTSTRIFPPGHFRLATYQVSYALCLVELGRLDAAEPRLVAAIPALRSTLGDDHPFTQLGLRTLVHLYDAQQRSDDAAPWRAMIRD